MPVQLLAVPDSQSSFLLIFLENSKQGLKYLGPCHLPGKTQMQFLTAGFSLSCYRHLRKTPRDERSLSLLLSFSPPLTIFQINGMSFKYINQSLTSSIKEFIEVLLCVPPMTTNKIEPWYGLNHNHSTHSLIW